MINCDIPPLLGFEFFNHETIISYTFKKNKLVLNRKYGYKYKMNEIDFCENTCNSYLSISKPETMVDKVENVEKLFGVKTLRRTKTTKKNLVI